jgi:hypothetical protein
MFEESEVKHGQAAGFFGFYQHGKELQHHAKGG